MAYANATINEEKTKNGYFRVKMMSRKKRFGQDHAQVSNRALFFRAPHPNRAAVEF
jgi:hypothetical protein